MIVTVTTEAATPTGCRICQGALVKIVSPEKVGHSIQNLGISPVAGREWTVTRCVQCGHVEFYLA